MTIIQYYGGKWDDKLIYMFGRVNRYGEVIRFEIGRGDLDGFEIDYPFNKMVIE